MNRREVRTRLTPAAAKAERMFRAPAVKFSITGIRPLACKAKKVTAAPMPVGRSTPTGSAGAVTRSILRPSAKAARIRSV